MIIKKSLKVSEEDKVPSFLSLKRTQDISSGGESRSKSLKKISSEKGHFKWWKCLQNISSEKRTFQVLEVSARWLRPLHLLSIYWRGCGTVENVS